MLRRGRRRSNVGSLTAQRIIGGFVAIVIGIWVFAYVGFLLVRVYQNGYPSVAVAGAIGLVVPIAVVVIWAGRRAAEKRRQEEEWRRQEEEKRREEWRKERLRHIAELNVEEEERREEWRRRVAGAKGLKEKREPQEEEWQRREWRKHIAELKQREEKRREEWRRGIAGSKDQEEKRRGQQAEKQHWLAQSREQAEQQERAERERKEKWREERLRRIEEVKAREAEKREEQRRRIAESKKQKEKERKERDRSLLRSVATLEPLRSMSGVDFERYMAAYFREQGYTVKMTPASGDRGADLILDKDEHRIAIQLKRYAKDVGREAVQQALAGRGIYDAHEAWVITTSSFTRGAKADASKLGVRLVGGEMLADWLQKVTKQREEKL